MRLSLRITGSSLATVLLAVMTLAGSALVTSPAAASVTRNAVGSFGPDGVGGSESFTSIQGVGTDPSSGAIYVLDAGASAGGRLYKFNAAGAPSNFAGLGQNYIEGAGSHQSEIQGSFISSEDQLAVAPAGSPGGTAGDIYVVSNPVIRIFSAEGLELGQIEYKGEEDQLGHEPCGVATDPAGHVFVGFYRSNTSVVREYTPAANPVSNADKTSQSAHNLPFICNVAADGLGNVYAANFLGNSVSYLGPGELHPLPEEEGEIEREALKLEPGASSLAVDPVTDELYGDTGSSIWVRKPSGGGFNGSFGSPGLKESRGLALSPDGESLYVGNGVTGKVEVYGPSLVVPEVETGEATSPTESTAHLTGTIDPLGGPPATCQFEYVSEESFAASGFEEAATAPCAPSGPFEGSGPQAVSAAITGLTRVTNYDYRLVGENSNGSNQGTIKTFTSAPSPYSPPPTFGPCPANEAFRTGAGSRLPDCRAYEQASPLDKNGGDVEAMPGAVQAAQGGDAVTFFSQPGVPGGVGAQDYPTFISTRGEGSWSTQGLLPPQQLGEQAEFLGLTPGGRYAISEATVDNGKTGVFMRNLHTGETTTVVPYNAECQERGGFEEGCEGLFTLAGASDDGSKVFLETTLPLTEETPAARPNLFVWDRESGESQLVDVTNPSEASSQPVPLPDGGFAGPYEWPENEPTQGGSRDHMYVSAINAIASDGSRVVFTERAAQNTGPGARLYLRENPTMPQSPIGSGGGCTVAADACTIQVSAPEHGASGVGEVQAAFLGATPEVGSIFFKSKQELTHDAYAGKSTKSWSLYRYDVASADLVDLTPDPGHLRANGPGVEGFLGASDSGRSAYFVATSVLTTEPGPGGSVPVQGQANLYHYEEGSSPELGFVATLEDGGLVSSGSNDSRDWSPFTVDPNEISGDWSRTAQVSGDGASVVFSSHRALTGVPNLAHGCNRLGGADEPLQPCAEFFRYSAVARTLDCVSCNPTGRLPLASATSGIQIFNAGDLPEVYASPVLRRNLSSDGNRFFFQTPDSLVGTDTNEADCAFHEGIPSCLDVYEWEAPGSGTCTESDSAFSSQNGGCLYLISGGQDELPSVFADADREGRNVFIFTAEQLVPADRDALYDAYDAREGGGLASQHEAPALPCAARQACQGPLKGSEAQATPGSSTFTGPGNPRQRATCRKGFVRKHGRCVKRHKTHRKHHRKRHPKKPKKHKQKQAAGRREGGER